MTNWVQKLDSMPETGRIHIFLSDGTVIPNVKYNKLPSLTLQIDMPSVLIVDIQLASWL